MERKITPSSGPQTYSYESVRYDTATNNINIIAYPTSIKNTIKAVSNDYTCAALFDDAQLSIVQFDNSTNNFVEDLIGPLFGLATADAQSQTFVVAVADSCDAIFVNGEVYHFSASNTVSNYATADTVSTLAWTNPVFNADFTYAVDVDGLYEYDSTAKSYDRVYATTFSDDYKIWTTSEAVVVLSWVASGTANKYNYSVEAFAIPTLGSTSFGTI